MKKERAVNLDRTESSMLRLMCGFTVKEWNTYAKSRELLGLFQMLVADCQPTREQRHYEEVS